MILHSSESRLKVIYNLLRILYLFTLVVGNIIDSWKVLLKIFLLGILRTRVTIFVFGEFGGNRLLVKIGKIRLNQKVIIRISNFVYGFEV